MPDWNDVMGGNNKKRSKHTTLPLNTAKTVSTVSLPVLMRQAMGTKDEADMKETMRQLTDMTWYAPVEAGGVNLADSRCSLTGEQVDMMVRNGFWKPFTGAKFGRKPKGVCRIFTVDELWKKRARVISWTFTINGTPGMKPDMELYLQQQVRHLVWYGDVAASIDGKSAFNQLGLDDDVGEFFCVLTERGWMQICRAPMGSRGAPKAAHTILNVISNPMKSIKVTYIDNLLGIGQKDNLQLLRDLEVVRDRGKEANYTFNEDLSDLEALIKEQVEFLGTNLDFKNKCVNLVDKVLAKLATVWSRRAEWTVRDFIVCVCVLQYTANVLGRSMAPWQCVLERWARAQGQCFADKTMLEAMYEEDEEVEASMAEWICLTLQNDWVDVPKNSMNTAEFVLVTDASKDMWSAIMSCSSGLTTTMQGEWPKEIENEVKSSSVAEPLAVIAAARTFIDPSARIVVKHVGDNIGSVDEINRGHSTKEGRFLAEYLHRHFPRAKFTSDHYPGLKIPTDELSRRKALALEKLNEFMKKFNLPTGGQIRDLSNRAAPANSRV